MRQTIPPIKMPKSKMIRLGLFRGVTDHPDSSTQSAVLLRNAENLRLDEGVAEIRTGVEAEWAADSPTAFCGIGTFRQDGTASTEATKHQLTYGTRPEVADDGSDVTLGAVYLLAQDGYGYYDITPETGLLSSSLTLADGDTEPKAAYFAQFADAKGVSRMYLVDGQNGMTRWAGWDGTGTPPVAVLVVRLEPPADFLTDTFQYPSAGLNTASLTDFSMAASSGADWTITSGTFGTGNVLGNTILTMTPVTASVAAKLVYHDTGAPAAGHFNFDEAQGAKETKELILAVKVNPIGSGVDSPFVDGNLTPLRLWIGTGDPTTGSSGFGPTDAYFWDLTFIDDRWHVFRLNLSNCPAAIRQDVRFVAFECLDVTAYDPTNGYTFSASLTYAPGGVSGTRRYLKAQLYNPDTNITSLPTSAFGLDFNLPDAGPVDDTGTLQNWPYGRFLVRVQFPADATADEEIRLYVTTPDPALSNPDGGNYHYAGKVLRSQADGDGKFQTYISISDEDLQVADAMPRGTEVAQTGDDAPRILIAKDTCLVAMRSNNHPNRIWFSDIGFGESMPQLAFDDLTYAGSGGWVDLGHGDGDQIMAAGVRGGEILVAKEHGIWAVQKRNEGADTEYLSWDFLTSPGTIAPRSWCRIPNAWCYFAINGLFVLQDGAEQATELPVSLPVQQTIDAIPLECLEKVAIGYDPIQDVVLVAVAEPGETENSCLLIMDRRLRDKNNLFGQWLGKWAVRDIGGLNDVDWEPKQLHWDGDNLFFTRADIAQVDRAKTLRDDDTPYTDIEQPIQFSAESGEITPYPEGKFRVLEEVVRFTHEPTIPGDSEARVNATLTVETRNGNGRGVRHEKSFNYTVDPETAPNGLMTSGKANEGNRLTPQTLEGEQVKVRIEGECSSNQPVRLLGITLKAIPKGPYRG